MILTFLFSLSVFAQNPDGPAVPRPSPISFFSDIENFRDKSLSLQTEKKNLEAASDAYTSSQLFWTPRLNVSANETKTRINQGATADQTFLLADATLNLYKAGADWNILKSRQAARQAQQLQVQNENLRVEIRASDLIFKLVYLYQFKKIQDDLLKLKEESLRILNDRYRQGQVPLQEVRKSEVDLVQQKNRARQAGLDVVENTAEIRSSFVDSVQTVNWPFYENMIPQFDTAAKMPTVEQKYWLSESQEQAWKASRGGLWPTIDLSVQYQQTPIKTQTDSQWVGLLQITFPLWTQFDTSAKISSAYAQYVGSMNDFLDAKERAKNRFEFLKQKIEVARTNLSEAKANVEKAKNLYQSIVKSFRLGRLSTNDMLLEQNRLIDSQTGLLQSQLAFHQTLVETCALVGVPSATCLR